MKVPVYSKDGSEAGSVEIDEALLGGQVRHSLLKQAFVAMHANRRQGSANNRGRGEKDGSTRKLFKQKGTGRARRGNVRTNVLRGGGVAFAKSPRSYRQDMPTKMRRLANRNALLSKCVDGEIKVVDAFDFEAPKTRDFANLLGALSVNRSCLLAVDPADTNTALSARNIADVKAVEVAQLNAYDLLTHRFLIISKASLEAYLSNLKPTGKADAGKEAA